MADINGTSGNDVLEPYGSSLWLSLSGTPAEGMWPSVNVLVNGVVVLSGISVTAHHWAGQTQLVSVPIADGTNVTNVTIEYTNDTQTSWASEDRNLYVTNVSLNGDILPVTAAVYHRTGGTDIPGQSDMIWGGSLEFSGSVVANATPITGGTVSVDGMAGIDTIVLDSSTRGQYTVTKTSTGHTATEVGGSKVVTMTSIERLDFSNIDLALDMTGNAGTVAKLISALFGSAYLETEQFVGLGLDMIDSGTSANAAAQMAIGTALFTSLAGSTSNTDFVELVYNNVMGHGPSQSELNQYVGMLDSGAQTKASLAVMAAESNQNAVHLVGYMDTGIEYS